MTSIEVSEVTLTFNVFGRCLHLHGVNSPLHNSMTAPATQGAPEATVCVPAALGLFK